MNREELSPDVGSAERSAVANSVRLTNARTQTTTPLTTNKDWPRAINNAGEEEA